MIGSRSTPSRNSKPSRVYSAENSVFCLPGTPTSGEQRAAIKPSCAYQHAPMLFFASVCPRAAGRPGNETSFCHPRELEVIKRGVEGACWVIAGGLFGDRKG